MSIIPIDRSRIRLLAAFGESERASPPYAVNARRDGVFDGVADLTVMDVAVFGDWAQWA